MAGWRPPWGRRLRGTTQRRLLLAGAGAAVLAAGLAVHYLGRGPVADFAADALYPAMVLVVLGVLWPRLRSMVLGAVAFAASAGIELAQLTGVPAGLAAAFPPFRLLLGTTFSALDLVAYAAGAAGAVAADGVARSRARNGFANRL
ncbi:DUF2809 domain-containing protein [Pseudarthrobacter sp. P1]|uniref:ribosomal maturation YjgA family protein n=1 Tax=Pseudarthrobacter sp. P1 TaxID=3418418 RepID=UPI003CEAEA02